MRVSKRRKPCRSGMAAVELALCLPMLWPVLSAVIDYSLLFSDVAILNDCARNGALHASGLLSPSPFASVTEAALANAEGLSCQGNNNPTIGTPRYGTDAAGTPYCELTVSYQYEPIVPWPALVNSGPITRTIRMATQP